MGLNFSKRDKSVHAICTYTKSSIVIPAWASTSFSPSSRILISSSIFSGAFPVFGSNPIRPARYNVLPARIASLNGACTGPPASLITLRAACGVGCENAPRTVRIPATAKTTTRKLMRRFMNCLHSNDLPNTPRECNTQIRLRQAVRRILACARQKVFSIASRNSFELERDKPRSNKVQRSKAHAQPKQHAEKEGAPPHLFQRGAGDAAANEEKCRGQAKSSESEEPLSEMFERGKIGIDNGGENKKCDEPGELDAEIAGAAAGGIPGAAAPDGRSREGKRNDPESAGEFYGGADDQSLGAVFRGGADDGTGVVNRQRGPESELRLRKVKRVSDRRKNQQGDRIQNKNRAERYRHFFFIGLKNGTDGGDGAAAANRRAGGDQK